MLLKLLSIFLGLVALVTSSCVMRRTKEMGEKDAVVFCFFVKDLKAQMDKIPMDVNVVSMIIVESDIPKIEAGVFDRFGSMERLEIHHSRVKEIEDHAFKGLTKLTKLSMRMNMMTKIKSGWMNDMTALTGVDFNTNEINDVDKDVDVSRLESVNIGANNIKCMDMDMMNMMTNVKSMKLVMNPLSWKCMIEMDDWMKNHPDVDCDFSGKELGLEKMFEVTRECMKTTTGDDEKMMDDCIESKMNVVVAR